MTVPDGEFKNILPFNGDWGVETGWNEMDELLYGAAKRGRIWVALEHFHRLQHLHLVRQQDGQGSR